MGLCWKNKLVCHRYQCIKRSFQKNRKTICTDSVILLSVIKFDNAEITPNCGRLFALAFTVETKCRSGSKKGVYRDE